MDLNMEFKKSAELDEKIIRGQMGLIFAEGFYQWLKALDKDPHRLARAFAHMFDLNRFYVAIVDGKIAAICAVSDDASKTVSFDAKILRKHLGFIKGQIAYIMLKKHLVDKKYPVEIPENCSVIEFVATKVDFRGQGVAGALLTDAMANSEHDQFILEVADTNTRAVNLYKRLGFREIHRVPAPHAKRSGFDFYLYMKNQKTEVLDK